MPPPVVKGIISIAFVCPSVHPSVCPSVRPSVAYIANNSRPSVPKFGRKVPHLRCDSRTSFKIKRSKVKVTRPSNAHTHRVPYLPNGIACKLQTGCTDGGRRPASATGAMTSKVKGQGRKVTWLVWAVLVQCCTCVIRGRRGRHIPCRPNPAARLLVHFYHVLFCSGVSVIIWPVSALALYFTA